MAIELIDKIKQKNGGTFKLMDAEDIAFGEHSLTEEIDSVKTQLSEKSYNKYANKTIVMFGDSITHISNYPAQVGKKLNCTVINVGMAGRCMSGDNPLSMCNLADAIVSKNFEKQTEEANKEAQNGNDHLNQLKKLKEIDFKKVDAITIAYGTNDYGFNMPLGKESDATKDTFYGAINYVIKAIQSTFPNLEIVFITPIFRTYAFNDFSESNMCDVKRNTNQDYLYNFVNAIIEVGIKKNVKVIDNYTNVGFNKYNWTNHSNDGVHPKSTSEFMISDSVSAGLTSTPLNNLSVLNKLMDRDIMENCGYLKLDSPYSTTNFYGSEIYEIDGEHYLTNGNTGKYFGIIMGIGKGICYAYGEKLKIKGQIRANYTGEARLDVAYFYELPLFGNVYKDGRQVTSSVMIEVDREEKDFEVVLTMPEKSRVSEEVIYTVLKVINYEIGNIYVRNLKVETLKSNSITAQEIGSEKFMNGAIAGTRPFKVLDSGEFVILSGIIDVTGITQQTDISVCNLNRPFTTGRQFAVSAMDDMGRDIFATITISDTGVIGLKSSTKESNRSLKNLYFDGIVVSRI